MCAANADPIDAARARGWHVELRPTGLLVDTQGQPSDLALMERLHAVVGQEPAWPAHLLSDPGEVVLRGELDAIEQEAGRMTVPRPHNHHSTGRVPVASFARRALMEAHARGWRIHFDDDGPVPTASVASLSPALVERLKEHADALAAVLMEDGR